MKPQFPLALAATIALTCSSQAHAQSVGPLRVVVNSNQDMVVKDQVITLREAILLVNGQMKMEDLSDRERTLVSRPVMSGENYKGNPISRIEFQLPADQTTIRLQKVLPAITKSGLVIDGTNSFNVANSVAGFTVTATESGTTVERPTIRSEERRVGKEC